MMDTAEVDDFLENVSQVSRLIDGLKAGTISPEYVDTKLQERDTKRSAGSQRGSTGAQAAAGRAPGGAPATGQADAGGDVDGAAAEARQAKLMRKVEELKRSRERKQQARQRYQDHIAARAAMAQQQQADAATDYGKWDLWCPSDEDDELFNSLCPDTLQFRALERDIDERHARCEGLVDWVGELCMNDRVGGCPFRHMQARADASALLVPHCSHMQDGGAAPNR